MAEQSATRKLVAILAADMVGYSRLMEADETGTIERQKTHRAELIDPKITEHHGRIVKTTGDGLLVEFGSVVDAVACAVEVQRAMGEREADVPEERRIQYRIGINLGDIVIDEDDIYGDGVNIAARLQELTEPGGVSVSGTAYEHLKAKVEVGYEYLGEQQVKNIEKPVRVYRALLDPEDAGKVIGIRRNVLRPWIVASAAAGLVVLVAAGGLVVWQPWIQREEPARLERMAFPLPDKPSIAVLPFSNMSDDPSQNYFADGMTEDLITDLSKVSGLFVIARNSSFSYKGQQVKVRQVAEELGVRYVLEGSVRRAGDQVRINAQLIDATTGGHLWADRYDGTLADVFVLQDQVTRRIVAALALNLTPGEAERRRQKETDNPEAYDAFLQGWEHYRRFTADDFVKAIPYFERAVELDPDYGRPYAALSAVYWKSWLKSVGDYVWTAKVNPSDSNYLSWEGARAKSEKYLALAMNNPTALAHQLASRMHSEDRQFDKAVAEAERGVALDPNDPEGYWAVGRALISAGRAEAAIAAAEKGMRLDPQYPWPYLYLIGLARIELGQFDEAAVALQRVLKWPSASNDVNAALAIAHALLDHKEEARAALKAYTDGRQWTPWVHQVLEHWQFKREVDIRRFGRGLLKAGLCCEEVAQKTRSEAGSERERYTLKSYIERLRHGGTLE
jgi:TolB-like protein/class 3 adenylate cyclase/Flp pilus assembly protein TadD